MTNDTLYGIICIIIGVGTLINWCFEMFSDSGYADLCRSMMELSFNLGRNTIALIEPSVGGGMFCAGLLLLSEEESHLESIVRPLYFFFVIVIAFGLIPFRFPKQMYPEWQMEKRRQRAAQARKKAEATDEASSSALQRPGLEGSTTPSDNPSPRAHQQDSHSPNRPAHHSTIDHHRREQ